ncbi:MAG: CBS domain-containing protein [Planctomycetaceae bacterium]|nr:MAG: CBS domain-containing protein [Planctomycetaceae bacterium]
MSVEKIMSTTVVTVEMDDSLKVVKEIFDNTRFHHLLVVESGKLFGVISDRDLLKALSPNIGTASETARDAASLNKRVHQIMTRKLVMLGQNAGIFDAIDIFINHNLSCIPVVDDGCKPVGIISWRDILKALESLRSNRPDKANQQGRS